MRAVAVISRRSLITRQLRGILASLPDDNELLARACGQVKIEDWTDLLLSAHAHGVAAIVLQSVKRAEVAVPRDALHATARRVALDTVWQDVLSDSLRQVLSALAEKQVEVVALKGPLLSERLYEDAAFRPSSDLDLLVAPESLDAAVRALAPLGYELEGGELGRFFRNHHHHVHMLHPTQVSLEIHFEAYRGFGTVLPAAPLLARAKTCALSRWMQARVLEPEDEFLYLAVHAASHRFQRLLWLYDLKLFTRQNPDMHWDSMYTRAREHHLGTVVSFACGLLSEWLRTPCPGSTHLQPLTSARSRSLQLLARPQPIHLANAVANFLFCSALCSDVPRVAAFAARFARTKVLHEAPMRAREFLSS